MPVHLREIKLSKEEKENHPDFQGMAILVYSDVYFDLFYERHCQQRKGNFTKTVIVIGEKEAPDKEIVRSAFVKGILEFKLEQGMLYIPLQAPLAARQWSGIKNNFTDFRPRPGFLRIQDSCIASYELLEKFCKMQILDKKEIETVKNIRNNAEKHKLLIKFVWFFGHIDVTFSSK